MNRVKFWLDALVAAALGAGVTLGSQSVDRAAQAGYAAKSPFFWLLFPGLIPASLLSGGYHAGNETVAEVLCWLFDVSFYWLIWMLLSWVFRKALPRSHR